MKQTNLMALVLFAGGLAAGGGCGPDQTSLADAGAAADRVAADTSATGDSATRADVAGQDAAASDSTATDHGAGQDAGVTDNAATDVAAPDQGGADAGAEAGPGSDASSADSGAGDDAGIPSSGGALHAEFVVVHLGARRLRFDANPSYVVDALGREITGLTARWDFDGDGTFDTEPATALVAEHTFDADGSFQARLRLRDAQGREEEARAQVSVSQAHATSYAATSIVADTRWEGTVLVTGNTLIAEGATLTIAPGTEVLVGGDVEIRAMGGLVAQGTAEAPILFTAYSELDHAPGGWRRLTLDSAATVSNVVIQYAELGLLLRASGIQVSRAVVRLGSAGVKATFPADIDNSEIALNAEVGVELSDQVNLRGSKVHHNGWTGVFAAGLGDWSFTVFDTECDHNSGSGVRLNDMGTLSMTQSRLHHNGEQGLLVAEPRSDRYRLEAQLERCALDANGAEGLRLVGEYNQDAAVSLVHCDLVGNALGLFASAASLTLQQSRVTQNLGPGLYLDTNVQTTVVVEASNLFGNATAYGVAQSANALELAVTGSHRYLADQWAAPESGEILFLDYSLDFARVSNQGSPGYCQLKIGSQQNGADIVDRNSSTYSVRSGIQHLHEPPQALYVYLLDESIDFDCSFTLAQVGYTSAAADTQAVVEDSDSVVTLSGNYWGPGSPQELVLELGDTPPDLSSSVAEPVSGAGR